MMAVCLFDIEIWNPSVPIDGSMECVRVVKQLNELPLPGIRWSSQILNLPVGLLMVGRLEFIGREKKTWVADRTLLSYLCWPASTWSLDTVALNNKISLFTE